MRRPYYRIRKKNLFYVFLAVVIVTACFLMGHSSEFSRLENRAPALALSKSGNVWIMLQNQSDSLSKHKFLVEIEREGDFRQLFLGAITESNQDSSNGILNFKILSFDVPFKEFSLIIHEENSGAVGVRRIMRGTAKPLYIYIDFFDAHEGSYSPYPYFDIRERTEPLGLL